MSNDRTNIPDIIYLQWFDDYGEPQTDEDGDLTEFLTWCPDQINESDIAYVRVTASDIEDAGKILSDLTCPYCENSDCCQFVHMGQSVAIECKLCGMRSPFGPLGDMDGAIRDWKAISINFSDENN